MSSLRSALLGVILVTAPAALTGCRPDGEKGGGHEPGGAHDAPVKEPHEEPHSAPRAEMDPADALYARGASSFARYCALCHKPDATGYAADHAPSLVSETFLESATDEFITKGIRDGRPGTAMAGYGKIRGGPLDDEEIAAIIAFLRDRGPPRVKISTAKLWGDATRGGDVYTSSCQQCHGTRTERGNAVHLANSSFLASASDGFLKHAIVHGRPGTPMPAFDGLLSDGAIDDVIAFLRTWQAPPERARQAPPEPPPLGEFVINPAGRHPDFKLRDDKYVPIDDVKKALDEKRRIVIIDARAVSDWYSNHIPGSISVPYYSFDRLDALPKDGTWITAYCACPHHASGVVVEELRRRGYKHTAVLDEGILEWKKRGYPIEALAMPGDMEGGTAPRTIPEMPAPPAVRLPPATGPGTAPPGPAPRR